MVLFMRAFLIAEWEKHHPVQRSIADNKYLLNVIWISIRNVMPKQTNFSIKLHLVKTKAFIA